LLFRKADVLIINEKFQTLENFSDSTGNIVCHLIVIGPKGSGKSELAYQYADYLVKEHGTSSVLAVNAQTPNSFESSFKMLALQLGCLRAVELALQISNKKQQMEILCDNIKYEMVLRPGWLFIIDNITLHTVEVVLDYLPLLAAQGWGQGQVLMTCTNEVARHFSVNNNLYAEHRVDCSLSISDSLDLLRLNSVIEGEDEEASMIQVTAIVQSNPMTLAAIAHFKLVTSSNWAQCLTTVKDQLGCLSQQRQALSPAFFDKILSMTVLALMAKNRALECPLHFLSLCSEEAVPLQAIKLFLNSTRTKKQAKDCIEAVQSFPFVVVLEDEGGLLLHLHTFFKTAIQSTASKKYWLETRLSILLNLKISEDAVINKKYTRLLLRQMLPHVLYVVESVAHELPQLSSIQKMILADTWFNCGQCIDFLGADCSMLLNHLEVQKQCLEKALDLHSALNTTKSFQIATELLQLGLVCDDLNLPLEAKHHLLKAVDVAKSTTSSHLIFRSLHVLGRILLDLGETKQAIVCLEECLSSGFEAAATNSVLRAAVLTLLGRGYKSFGLYDVAESVFVTALQICQKAIGYGYFSPEKVKCQVLAGLGRLYLEPGLLQVDKAMEALQKSLDIRIDLDGYTSQSTALTLTALGRAHLMKHEFDIAKLKLTEALAVQREVLPRNHSDTAITLHILGNVECQMGNLSDGIRLLQESKAIKEQATSTDSPKSTMFVSTDLANALLKVGQLNKALDLLQRALQAKQEHFGDSHIEVGIAYGCLHDAYCAIGNTWKASECLVHYGRIMQVQNAKKMAKAVVEKKSLAQGCLVIQIRKMKTLCTRAWSRRQKLVLLASALVLIVGGILLIFVFVID
jgi:tetratricopeptide (TPR) repeat protein/DNA polymerase III delta prime subunit